MGRDHPVPAEAGAEAGEQTAIAERLEAIEEQGRLTFELLKTLVGLLVPKGERDGPSLEDLIAAVVAQQRDLLTIARATRSEVRRLIALPATCRSSEARATVISSSTLLQVA